MLSDAQLKDKLDASTLKTSCGCHVWLRGEAGNGYGQISIGGGKQDYAHRVSYRVNKGQIPEGAVVMHSCDIPACCNPEHLTAGSQTDNMQDCKSKSRQNRPSFAGSRNGRSKLNEKTAVMAYLDERDYHVIAAEYGVTWQSIKLLKGGKTWHHAVSAAKEAGLSTAATPTAQA